MENTVEFTQGKNFTSENFLTKELSITQLPNEFSFNNEIKYGLLSLNKWTEKSNNMETAGVFFVDPQDKIRFKDTAKGLEDGVPIVNYDFSMYSAEEAKKHMDIFLPGHPRPRPLYNPGFRPFCLIPKDFSDNLDIYKNVVIEKGKKILGDIHTHPLIDSSFSPHDLSKFLLQSPYSDYTTKCMGVITKDNLYLLVRTKETTSLKIKNENDLSNYSKGVELEMKDFSEKMGISLYDALMPALIKQCERNNIGFYFGNISENKFQKIV